MLLAPASAWAAAPPPGPAGDIRIAEAPGPRGDALRREWQQRYDAAGAAYQRGDAAEALRLQLALVAWVRTSIPPSSGDPILGLSLKNLGALQSVLGQTREALASSREAAALLRAVTASQPRWRAELAGALQNQARSHADLGEYRQALPIGQEAVALARTLVAGDAQGPLLLARTLIDLATVLDELGRLPEALAAGAEAVALLRRQAASQPDLTAELALALQNLGAHHTRLGEERQALAATREAVDLYRRLASVDPFERTTLAAALLNLGSNLSTVGRPQEALAPSLEAVALMRALARSNPLARLDLAESLNSLGVRQAEVGQLAESLRSAEEAVALLRDLAAAEPARREVLARALNSLGARLDALGRGEEALKAMEEAATLLDDPALRESSAQATQATVLANLGMLQMIEGQLPEAIATLVRAVDLHREGMQSRPTLLAGMAAALDNLGSAYARQQQWQEALTAANLAVQIRRDLAAANPGMRRDLPGVLNNLANRLRALGRDPEALSALQEALAIQRELSRTHGAALGDGLLAMNSADLQLRKGDQAAALALLEEMVSSDLLVLQRQLPLLPERRRQALVQNQGLRWQVPFSLAGQGDAGARLALLTRLNRQGLLQDIQRRQAQLARSSPLRALADQLTILSSQLANGALAPAQRQQLEARREQLEQELYRQLPDLQARLVQPAEVAPLLPADGRLVEFQRYRPHDPREDDWPRSFGPPRYLALVLRPDGHIAAIDLGPAVTIDSAVGRALRASAANLADAPDLWAVVGGLVLAPLRAELAGAGALFLSPDGELNRVPFAALPALAGPGRLLGETVQLRLLTSGRDLLRLQRPPRAGGAALVVADPSFDGGAPAAADPAATPPGRTGASRGGPGGQRRSATLSATARWQPLPGTAAEARQVAPLLQVAAAITGREATAARILQARAPWVMHIATHGFFAPDQAEAPTAAGRDSPPSGSRAGSSGPAAPEDPLLRSGLALAGANVPDANPTDDGYLTAAEVTGIDLDGTELVTLSACETGLGDLRSGEGVYGLQRALTVAGSRSTLLSLWKVDDAATAAFMVDFYQRLRSGAGRAEALAATQAAFRSHPNPLFRDLHVWGAFQLSGDWRPLPKR
ncbi:MAG: CHAT domain-containing tetratricopeptide repeat protein [Cyanobacteriota bacterium]|nr:CHAT domain-containing tetratricopeptide repeat protein [Cyanobacteriota bacterium]